MLKNRKPIRKPVANFCADGIGEFDIRGTAGEDGELIVETGEVQFGDDAVMPLLQYESAALNGELACDEFEFSLGEFEAVDIVGVVAASIREEDLRRALLDDRVCDR